MSIKTDNKIFKRLRANPNFVRRMTQRKIDRRNEEQKKLIELKQKQLKERKKEASILEQNKLKQQRAIVSNNEKVIINRTVNGITTTTNQSKQILGKVIKTGVTTEDEGHVHRWSQYEDGSIIIHEAKHPSEGRIKHDHDFKGVWKNGWVTWNKSNCYQDNPNQKDSCESLYGVSGAPLHKHQIKFTIG